MKTTPQTLPPFLVSVSSRFGAPMGRPNVLPADLSTVRKLSLSFVPFTDGDYDAGGAYWGGGKDSLPLWCIWGESEAGEPVEFYLRETDVAAAASEAAQRLSLSPGCEIVNVGLSDFARAYVTAALWLMDEEDTGSKEVDDIDPATLAEMAQEADLFAAQNRADIEAAELAESRAGHCFWLSRNGHGSGFFDEPEARASVEVVNTCDRLQEASRKAGSRDLYRGDDGKIYQE